VKYPTFCCLLAAILLLLALITGCVESPDPQTVGLTVKHLDQNWSQQQRTRFYHASQGTVLMKADWFEALEQPEIKFVGTVHRVREDEYLARFGFLPDEKSEWNPGGLPVGFAVSEVTMPEDGTKQTVVGLTCAACHTGQLHFDGRAIRIDGATALIDVTGFQKALGGAFLLTVKTPWRFDRFARRVLGDDYNADTKLALHNEVTKVYERGRNEKIETMKRQLYDGHDGGFGRTDALAKIGNLVFGTKLDDDNLRVGNAPVRFPPIWDTPWFDWTQYNGSIEQPMVRNIGEALGVRGLVNLNPDSERFLQTTVDIEGLHEIEMLLAGDQPLQGLHSPQWPVSVFGEIERGKASRGAELYRNLCQKCHLPPLESDEIWQQKYWIANDEPSMTGGFVPPDKRESYLNLAGINLGKVGTDPGQATNFFARYVNTGKTILPSLTSGIWRDNDWGGDQWYEKSETSNQREHPESIIPVGVALQKLTVAISQKYYDEQGFSREKRQLYIGNRNPVARSPLEYRPRPLNGIWASPPYLHNGSVRTVYQLLSPHEERETVFYVGTRQYDPEHLGYKNIRMRGAFRYDTRVDGNRNTGHLFDTKPIGNGVIGPKLSVEERFQIIEYLKSLGPAGVPPQLDDKSETNQP
jgi:hypothetical protein